MLRRGIYLLISIAVVNCGVDTPVIDHSARIGGQDVIRCPPGYRKHNSPSGSPFATFCLREYCTSDALVYVQTLAGCMHINDVLAKGIVVPRAVKEFSLAAHRYLIDNVDTYQNSMYSVVPPSQPTSTIRPWPGLPHITTSAPTQSTTQQTTPSVGVPSTTPGPAPQFTIPPPVSSQTPPKLSVTYSQNDVAIQLAKINQQMAKDAVIMLNATMSLVKISKEMSSCRCADTYFPLVKSHVNEFLNYVNSTDKHIRKMTRYLEPHTQIWGFGNLTEVISNFTNNFTSTFREDVNYHKDQVLLGAMDTGHLKNMTESLHLLVEFILKESPKYCFNDTDVYLCPPQHAKLFGGIMDWFTNALAAILKPFWNVLLSIIKPLLKLVLEFLFDFVFILETLLVSLEDVFERVAELLVDLFLLIIKLLNKFIISIDSKINLLEFLIIFGFTYLYFGSYIISTVITVFLIMFFGLQRYTPSILLLVTKHINDFHSMQVLDVNKTGIYFSDNSSILFNNVSILYTSFEYFNLTEYYPEYLF